MNKHAIIIILSLFLLLPGMVWAWSIQTTDIGPNIENKATKKVAPIYPPLAKRKRIEGKVIVKLQVNADGTVLSTEFSEGNSLFKPASMEAAKQWIFQKTSNGMTGHIIFKFQLEEEGN
jgi:TonB family protein